MSEEYTFGECTFCKRILPLWGGYCCDCQDQKLPDIFRDLFGKEFKEGKNEEPID